MSSLDNSSFYSVQKGQNMMTRTLEIELFYGVKNEEA